MNNFQSEDENFKPTDENFRLLLHKFCKKNASRLKQGSDEWREYRRGLIGGSEMHSFCNGNYEPIARSKLGIDSFKGNQYTRWGNIFEYVSRNIISDLLSAKIWEVGNLPVIYDGDKVVHGVSPDGFAIVEDPTDCVNYFNRIFGKKDVTLPKDTHIVEFEFKSPSTREITSEIPGHYEEQLLSELSSMPMAKYNLFVDTKFALRKLGEEKGHYRGFFAIVGTDSPLYCGHLADEIDAIFEQTIENGYELIHSFDDSDISKIDKNILAIVPWYLEDAAIIPIHRDPEFPFNIANKIIDFMRKIEKLRGKDEMTQTIECMSL
jgi:hypothetical protein